MPAVRKYKKRRNVMKSKMLKMLGIVAIGGAVSLVGCDNKSGEKAGASIDKAAENTKSAVSTAADKTTEGVKKAATATQNATGKAVEKTGEALKKAGTAVENTGTDMKK
jgi:hypothetical protein